MATWDMFLLFLFLPSFCCAAPAISSKSREPSKLYKLFDVDGKAAEGVKNSESVKVLAAGVRTSTLCEACKLFSNLLEAFLEGSKTEEDVAKLAEAFCVWKKIEDKRVCDSAVEEFKEEVLTVAYSISLGRAKLLCAILLGPSCEPAYNPENQTLWKIPIPGDKPPVKSIPEPKVSLIFFLEKKSKISIK